MIYWENDTPRGLERFAPAEPLPDAGELIRRAGKHTSPTTPSSGRRRLDASRLSLIIPTRDRPEALRSCLESLARQDVLPGEVIVVDNDPGRPGTRAVVQGFAFATYVAETEVGLDHARNAGIAAARRPLLAFCDDDVVLHRAWSARMAAAFADPEVMAVTGLVLPLELRTTAQRLFEFGWGFGRGFERIDFRRGRAGIERAPWNVGAGASMAFRREVFEHLGVFDTRLDAGAAGCSGDSEMWYRILMAGRLCRYEPEIVSFHRHRTSMEELRRQIRAYMRGHVTALLIQHQRYRDRANLRRAFLDLPRSYAWRGLRRLAGRRDEGDCLLRSEIAGFLDGFVYFARHPRERPQLVSIQPAAI